METLDYIIKKFDLETWRSEKMPIYLPHLQRYELAVLFKELGFEKGVEIGVERGRFSKELLFHNPNLFLYGVDPWSVYPGYRDYVSQEQLDGFYQQTVDRLTKYKLFSRVCLIKKFSLEAVKDFEDNSLDFVYIDGNHDLLNVISDIVAWTSKVRSGGIVSGHDYTRRKNTPQQSIHVIEGCVAYTTAYEIFPWFVFGGSSLGTGNFFWVKK